MLWRNAEKEMSCAPEKLWREVKYQKKTSTADMTKLVISAALINILKIYSPNYDLHVLQLTIIESKTCFKSCPKTCFKACPKTCMLVDYSRDKIFLAFVLLCGRELLQSSASE